MTPTLPPEVLRSITAELVERMRGDLMIGFHFRNVDPARLSELEYQHAAAQLGPEILGIEVAYEGRSLKVAHAVHRIPGGHFGRRRELLRQLLVEREIDPALIAHWLQLTDADRPQIVQDRGECH
jgi:hypothetical protein